jgi:hypothetical protein
MTDKNHQAVLAGGLGMDLLGCGFRSKVVFKGVVAITAVMKTSKKSVMILL